MLHVPTQREVTPVHVRMALWEMAAPVQVINHVHLGYVALINCLRRLPEFGILCIAMAECLLMQLCTNLLCSPI